MPLAARAGHPTFWQVFGSGPRPGLAIHCALASSSAWAGVGERLAGRLTLTAFDLPGHGRSAAWSGAGDYLGAAVRIAAGFADRPLDLIGHSFGAVVALRLALDVPERVRTLTLIEPVLFAAARESPAFAAARDAARRLHADLAEGAPDRAAAAFTAVWGAGTAWGALPETERAAILQRIHLVDAGSPALFEDTAGILAAGGLEGLAMPVLLLCGDRSPAIAVAIAEALAARLPDAVLAKVPGAAHLLPMTHPAETAGLIGLTLDRG